MPGIGAHATGFAARHWPHSHQDPRLRATWHTDPVCRAQLSRGQADHPPGRASSPSGVAGLSQNHRCGDPGRSRHPHHRDNYATHKHPAVTRWLDRHARFHMHYTPTSSSWMNLVERFFRDLTEFITEKSFASTRELADAIIVFLAARNDNPRRYVWKAKGEDILRKIDAARQALAALQPASNAISETAHQARHWS